MSETRRTPGGWTLVTWSLVGLGVLLFLRRCLRLGGFFAEDAYITFRFAAHLADGHGLVWNPGGEPVEGYTSPLHVGLLALTRLLGAPLASSAWVIGILSVLGVAAVYALFLRREAGRLTALSAVALGLYLVDGRVAIHATAGLDTTMYMFLLAVNFVVGVRLLERPEASRALAVAAIDFVSLLGRPDAAPYILGQGLVFLAVGLWRLRRQRDGRLLGQATLAYATLVVAGFGYLGLKYLYFGYVLPNPYYIKSGGLDTLYGLASVRDFVLSMRPWLVFVPALLLLDRDRLRAWWERPGAAAKLALLTVPPAVFLAYYTTVVQEVNYLDRFEYPAYFFLLAGVGLVLAVGRPEERLMAWLQPRTGMLPAGALVLVVLVGLMGAFYRAKYISFPWFEIVETRYYRPIGEALRGTGLGPRATLVFDSAGVVPYLSEFTHVDPVGLTENALSGREPITVWEREEYIWSRDPDLYIGPEPPATGGATSCADDPVLESAFARDVLLREDRFETTAGYLKSYGGLGMEERCELIHHRMRRLRDRWVFLGEIPWPVDAPASYTTFAYVRADSPHRETLARALRPLIARTREEIDWLPSSASGAP